MHIQGRRVLLTGACGGLGRALAAALQQAGTQLVLSARQSEPLHQLAASLPGSLPIVADLSLAQDIDALIEQAGEIDILIANAGQAGTGELGDWSTAAIDSCLAVNLRAPILLAQKLLPGMRARGRGHLLFINSVAGKMASPLASLYSASKYGLRGFADSLRLDLQGSGVDVTSIFPGPIRDAGMYANSGAPIPRGAACPSTDEVSRRVIRALERRTMNVDVCARAMQMGIHIAHFSPTLNARLQNLLDTRSKAASFARGHQQRQVGKRPS